MNIVEKYYVNQSVYTAKAILWKSPVDKPVDNVEKYEFSTAKPMFYEYEPPVWLWKTGLYNDEYTQM